MGAYSVVAFSPGGEKTQSKRDKSRSGYRSARDERFKVAEAYAQVAHTFRGGLSRGRNVARFYPALDRARTAPSARGSLSPREPNRRHFGWQGWFLGPYCSVGR